MKPLYWDAINPFTGQPFAFDDPNLFWGDPYAYYLEPGDPGFVPYDVPHQPPPKPQRMKRQAYYPSRVADQILWLENFRNKLAGYQAALGLSDPQVAAAIADARWLVYVLGSWLPAVRAFAPACTDAATAAQTGSGSSPLELTVFTAPALPTGVAPVLPGALTRIFALVGTIKDSAGFTEAIGTDLGLIGAGQTGPDMATIQPVLTLKVQGATVLVGWGWQGFSAFLDQLELQVDRGAGWGPLAFDTTPNYTDTAPFPATPARWKYRAIYHAGDAPVGVWSAEVSIMVGG
jgi:hypothetical protein